MKQELAEQIIDLNKELIRHPSATFMGRVAGDSMIEEGVQEGDVLIIDRSLTPRNGDKVICFYEGEFIMRTLELQDDYGWLHAANPKYKPIRLGAESPCQIWGVVSYIIKNVRTR
jgi:DNA polymerase V